MKREREREKVYLSGESRVSFGVFVRIILALRQHGLEAKNKEIALAAQSQKGIVEKVKELLRRDARIKRVHRERELGVHDGPGNENESQLGQ